MNKSELISAIAKESGLTKKNANIIVNVVFDVMKKAIMEDGELRISDFGTFKIKELKAREGRNPATGEKVNVPPTKILRFKVANKFKQQIKNL